MLKTIRKQNKFTQEELGMKIGKSRSCISRLEGKHLKTITIDLCVGLSRALDTSPVELFLLFAEIDYSKSKNQKIINADYKQLCENLKDKFSNERDELIATIKNLQKQLNRSEIKLNDNIGRKAYSNPKVIENIYNLYLKGKSLQSIANELNALKIKTNQNKDWSKSSIRYILLNSKNISNGFVKKDVFKRTAKLLNDNKK